MLHQINQACLDACNACADACDRCSTACLQVADVKMMARCIALDMDCAAICRTAVSTSRAARVALMFGSEQTRAFFRTHSMAPAPGWC